MRDEAAHRGQRYLANSWSMKAQEFEREADAIRDGISRLDAAQQAEL
jgi:hypothetical protein